MGQYLKLMLIVKSARKKELKGMIVTAELMNWLAEVAKMKEHLAELSWGQLGLVVKHQFAGAQVARKGTAEFEGQN